MQVLIDSLGTAVFGMTVVFAVLVGLIILIKVLNMTLVKATKRDRAEEPEQVYAVGQPEMPILATNAVIATYEPSALKLIDVDEQTAAIIMAIVCDEIGAPVNELYFKSIRRLGNQVPAQNKGV
jgi:Na+-transporting methylmalonyl-CoA/oxaloacetate decarboxylase gamma subunit